MCEKCAHSQPAESPAQQTRLRMEAAIARSTELDREREVPTNVEPTEDKATFLALVEQMYQEYRTACDLAADQKQSSCKVDEYEYVERCRDGRDSSTHMHAAARSIARERLARDGYTLTPHHNRTPTQWIGRGDEREPVTFNVHKYLTISW